MSAVEASAPVSPLARGRRAQTLSAAVQALPVCGVDGEAIEHGAAVSLGELAGALRPADDEQAKTALSEKTIDRLADALAERLDARQLERSGWVGADVVAAHLGVSLDYVFRHARELGVVRLGDGPKARLRFRLALVDAALCEHSSRSESAPSRTVEQRRRRRPTSRLGSEIDLLPIRGRKRVTA